MSCHHLGHATSNFKLTPPPSLTVEQSAGPAILLDDRRSLRVRQETAQCSITVILGEDFYTGKVQRVEFLVKWLQHIRLHANSKVKSGPALGVPVPSPSPLPTAR